MTRREPTIHNRALTVQCPRCGCVPGARCMTTRGGWLADGKAHRDRTELYLELEADRQAREAGGTELVCQWCHRPIPAGTAAQWDGKPQCPDPFACDKRTQSREAGR